MPNFNDEFIQYTKKKEKKETKNIALSLSVQITIYVLLIFFAIFFIWYTAFISTHKYYAVYGASMKNNLNSSLKLDDGTNSEDAVYVDCISKIKVFDVIVAKKKPEDVVKRVMAVGEDYVSIALHTDEYGVTNLYYYRIAKGTDLKNFNDEDARLDESKGLNGYSIYSYENWTGRKDLSTFVSSNMEDVSELCKTFYERDFFLKFLDGNLDKIQSGSDDFFISNSGMVYVKVPKGKYFCMGDNRGYSEDSRHNGFFDKSQIVGRVEIVVKNHNFGKRVLQVIKYYFSEIEKFFAR